MRNIRINLHPIRFGWLTRAVVLAVCLWVFMGSVAQQFPLGRFKDFNLPQYYAPPHATQMKSLLQGAEALPQDGGRILIKQLKLQTFREDGAGEFILLAEDCLYDPEQRSAHSPGALEMKTADGLFFTVGEGFLYRETESSLIISNRVHTVIQTGGKTVSIP